MDELRKLKLKQHQVLHVAQLRKAGVTDEAIRWRVCKGNWRRVFPKVIALFSGDLNRKQQLIAAYLHAGDDAQIASWTALELHGFRYAPRRHEVYLLIPQRRQPSPSAKVKLIRTTRLDRNAWPNGILRVSSPARAVVDALRGSTNQRQARAIMAEVVQKRMATVTDLALELKSAPRNGTGAMRRVLDEVAAGARSAPEAELQTLAKGSRLLKHMRWNPHLPGLPTPDGHLDDAKLAVEVDSYEFHLDAEGWKRTMRHDNALAAAGILVLRFTPTEIREEPHRVVKEIEAAYLKRIR